MPKFNSFASGLVGIVLMTGPVLADTGHSHKRSQAHDHGHAHEAAAIGRPGKSADVDRTINVTMSDNEFSLIVFHVKKGETIRFRITNTGDNGHEFSIGTPTMHAGHREKMLKMLEDGTFDDDGLPTAKDHDDANTISLAPGKTGELIWTFTKSGDLEVACNLPGHYESGMKAKLAIRL